MTKKRILVVCPNSVDATSFYRGAGPLTSLVKSNNVEVIFDDNFDWPTLKLADLVFFQRPGGGDSVELLKKAKNANIPVWADYDDLLTAMPLSNPNYTHYTSETILGSIWTFLMHSDYLTVSTPYLSKMWETVGAKPPIVIPNAWDEKMLPNKFDAKNAALVWRGSATHDEDLYSIINHYQALKDKDWKFIGTPFWLALKQLDKYTTFPWKDLTTFNRLMEQVRGTVQIVPLADNAFSRSKSNIAWMEASRVGSVTVAPNWEEWRRPGILNYNDGLEFVAQVERAYSDFDFVKSQNKLSWDYIEANLRLSEVNKKRLEIIEGAL